VVFRFLTYIYIWVNSRSRHGSTRSHGDTTNCDNVGSLFGARRKTQRRRWSRPLLSIAWTTVTRCATASPTNWRAVSSERYRQARDGHQAMRSYLACAPPAALTSYVAARRVQDCDSRPPVLVRQRTGLPGRRLSARRRCPCQTTAFYQHSNTRTLVVSRTRSSFGDRTFAAAGPQVWNSLPPNIRLCGPVQAVTEDIFIRTVRPRRSVNCFNCAKYKYS